MDVWVLVGDDGTVYGVVKSSDEDTPEWFQNLDPTFRAIEMKVGDKTLLEELGDDPLADDGDEDVDAYGED